MSLVVASHKVLLFPAMEALGQVDSRHQPSVELHPLLVTEEVPVDQIPTPGDHHQALATPRPLLLVKGHLVIVTMVAQLPSHEEVVPTTPVEGRTHKSQFVVVMAATHLLPAMTPCLHLHPTSKVAGTGVNQAPSRVPLHNQSTPNPPFPLGMVLHQGRASDLEAQAQGEQQVLGISLARATPSQVLSINCAASLQLQPAEWP